MNNINLKTKPLKTLRNTQGYSLVEIVFVIIFLGMALTATLSMTTSGLRNSVNTQFVTTATNLANEKMEEIYADKKTKGYPYIVQNNYSSETNPGGNVGYYRYVIITDQSTYKEVKVKVTHADLNDCILTAYLTNY